jgi:tetratricopeptide (TPR) repeat protein
MDARKEVNRQALAVQRRFVARREEQQHFREAFRQILHARSDIDLTQQNKRLFLINAQGGWGKTTLLDRFIQICFEEDPSFKSLVIKIDWELYRVDKELDEVDKAIKVMDILYDELTPEYENYFREYRAKRERHAEILQERDRASKEFDGWLDLTADVVELASPVSSPLIKPAIKTIVQTVVPVIAEQRKKFSDWFRRRLRPDDYDLYDDPKGHLSRLFVKALLKAAQKRPLVLMFDTSEHLLHVKWVYSGLIKYTIPDSYQLLLVIAGRIPKEILMYIRNNIRDSYIYKSDLDAFSRIDVEDYLRLCVGETDIPPNVIDFIHEKTKGIPLAVDVVGNAFTRGYDLPQAFGEGANNIDIDSIIETVAYRFLKHCLDDPNRSDDRDYIYTFAVMPDEVENEFPVIDFVWKRLFGEKIETVEIISRLQSEYSFIFPNNRMHSIVKYFVCTALAKGKLSAGRLFEINQAALDYYYTKTISFKDYQTKFRNRNYQEAAIGRLNHLFWLNDIEAGVSFLCDVYSLAIRYGEFDFASRFLAALTTKEWLRSRLSTSHDELITSLQHFGVYIGRLGENLPSVVKLKEQIFSRLDTETKILTLIDEAVIAAKAKKLKLALEKLEQVERLVTENSFIKERAAAYQAIGITARRQRYLNTAIKCLSKAYSLSGDVRILIEIGHTRSQNNEKEEAIKVYNEVLRIDRSKYFVSKFIESLSRPSQTITDHLEHQLRACYSRLKGLTKVNIAYYRTHSQISKLLMQQGRLHEALKARQIAEQGFSNLACTFNKSSGLYLLIGDSKTALEKARIALEIGDDNPGTYLSMGDVYRFLGHTPEAKKYYDLAISTANRHKQTSKQLFVRKKGLYGKGLTLLLESEFENGLQTLEQAYQIMHDQDNVTIDAQVLVAVGLAFVLNERIRRAENFFKETIELSEKIIAVSPSAYEPYYNKFIALVGLSRFDEAENLLRQCLGICDAKGVVTLALEKISLIGKIPRYSEQTSVFINWLREYL